MSFIINMEPLRIQSASGIHLPTQSEYPYHPLKHMESLRLQSVSGIHLPMPSEYPCHPLNHMEPLRIQSASGIHLPTQSEYPYHPLTHGVITTSVCFWTSLTYAKRNLASTSLKSNEYPYQ